jgi:hypothetical protein
VAKLKPQQCAAKVNYNAWLRLIRDPPKVNDAKTMERLWQGAFQILDADDRDVKQRLPQDLESNGKFGREHMVCSLFQSLPAVNLSLLKAQQSCI